MRNKSTCRSAPALHSRGEGGFFTLRTLVTLLICGAAACSIVFPTISGFGFLRPEAASKVSPTTLTFADRVAYQTAIEDVYWRHRIWPDANTGPKPPLDKVMSQADIEKKVEGYLRDSQVLEDDWQRPITADQLQAEMERMATNTKQPEVLQELFEALGNDPFVIAECLARPILAERLLMERLGGSSAPSLDDKSNREAIKNSRSAALTTI